MPVCDPKVIVQRERAPRQKGGPGQEEARDAHNQNLPETVMPAACTRVCTAGSVCFDPEDTSRIAMPDAAATPPATYPIVDAVRSVRYAERSSDADGGPFTPSHSAVGRPVRDAASRAVGAAV